jgi:hypothetical protein
MLHPMLHPMLLPMLHPMLLPMLLQKQRKRARAMHPLPMSLRQMERLKPTPKKPRKRLK